MQICGIMGSVNFTKKIKANFRSVSMESLEPNDNNISHPNYTDRRIFCKGAFFILFFLDILNNPIVFLCDVNSCLFLVSITLSSSRRSLQAQYIRTEYDGQTYC